MTPTDINDRILQRGREFFAAIADHRSSPNLAVNSTSPDWQSFQRICTTVFSDVLL